MDSLQDMLQNKRPTEPPQVAALKKYALDNYATEITVRVSPKHYLITVKQAAIANKLHIETAKISEHCQLDKRLVIHVGY